MAKMMGEGGGGPPEQGLRLAVQETLRHLQRLQLEDVSLFDNTSPHREKLRSWQLVLVLLPLLQGGEAATAQTLAQVVQHCGELLGSTLRASTRFLVEWVLFLAATGEIQARLRVAGPTPDESVVLGPVGQWILLQVENVTLRPTFVCTMIGLLVKLGKFLRQCMGTASSGLLRRFQALTLAHVVCTNVTVRVCSASGFQELQDAMAGEGEPSCSGDKQLALRLAYYMTHNNDAAKHTATFRGMFAVGTFDGHRDYCIEVGRPAGFRRSSMRSMLSSASPAWGGGGG